MNKPAEQKPAPAPAALATRDTFATLERIAREVNVLSLAKIESRFEQADTLAAAMIELERSLAGTDLMKRVMALQGSGLGFRCDEKGPYPEPVVRRALIEATIRGVLPIGNQFNIIAARCYVTKEGYRYLLDTFPGLTDLKETYGVPQLAGARAIVKCGAKWSLDGKGDDLEAEIPIIVNSGMRDDAILGKAERKLLARIYRRVTSAMRILAPPDGDVDDDARAAAAKNVSPGQQRISTADLFSQPTDVDARRLADIAAEAAERDAAEAAQQSSR